MDINSIDHDYLQRLYDDLIEQFRGQPNIQVMQKALARQLNDVHKFFCELRTLRWLQDAEGVQLDGVGDIAVLSRMQALILSQLAGQNVPMDDATYRLYLAWKIALNTSTATYPEIYRSLKMFWPYTPLYYSEDPAHPATIFFTLPGAPVGVDFSVLNIARMIKAAGVALIFIVPEERDVTTYSAVTKSLWLREYIICDEEPLPTDFTDYSASALVSWTREYTLEDIPIHTEATNYGAATVNEIVREEIQVE